MAGKEASSVHKLFEISMETEIEDTDTSYIKKTWTRKNRFFSARVVNLWNELEEKSVAIDIVEKFKRKRSEFG